MKTKHEMPLLKDHHTHPSIYAVLSNCINISSIKDKQEALLLIENSKDEISVILGWNNSFYCFEDEELDNLPPVVICNISLHSFLINKSARETLYHSYEDIITHIDDSQWVERNLYTILKFIAGIKRSDYRLFKSFFDNGLLKSGIWYAEDMLLPNKEILNNFQRIGYLERTKFWADIETINSLNSEEKHLIHGIKIFTDGAIGAKTAAIRECFLTGEKGILIYSDKQLFIALTKLSKFDKPIAIHAIGDLATDQTIRVLTNIYNSEGCIPQIRIEHCQFISKENAEKAKSLGIVLSMQPNFTNDSLQYTDRLPVKYCRINNPFRMLIDEAGYITGEDLVFGSDGMPHGINYALKQGLFPPFKNQALTLKEFIAGYCMPDKKHGYIEVEIDNKQQSIKTKLVSEYQGSLLPSQVVPDLKPVY